MQKHSYLAAVNWTSAVHGGDCISTATTETRVTAWHDIDTRAGFHKAHLALAMTTNGYFVDRICGQFNSSSVFCSAKLQ